MICAEVDKYVGAVRLQLPQQFRQELDGAIDRGLARMPSKSREELKNPVMLCGSMFGLETRFGSQLRRHRLFETSFPISYVPECNHKKGSVIGVYGGGQHPGRRYHRDDAGELVAQRKRIPATITVTGNSGGSSNRDGIAMFGTQDRRDAMGIQWMSGKELSQAIPPAYTLGRWASE